MEHSCVDGNDVIAVQAEAHSLNRYGQRYDNGYIFVIHFKDAKKSGKTNIAQVLGHEVNSLRAAGPQYSEVDARTYLRSQG